MQNFLSFFINTALAGEGDGSPACDIASKICNPLTTGGDLMSFINAAIKLATQLGAILCVLAIIYAGFKYVTSGGQPKNIETAHKAFLYAIVGTAILLGANVIMLAIQGTITGLAK